MEYLGVNYLGLIPHLVRGVQEMADRLDAQDQLIAEQGRIITSLQEKLASPEK